MKIKGAEIIAFWEDHRKWCKMSGLGSFFLYGCKDEYIADEISNGISKILIDPNSEYDLCDFGEIAPCDGGGHVTFEDAFFNWKANIPSDFRVNNKILQKLEGIKIQLQFVDKTMRESISKTLDEVILELSDEGEEE